MTSADKELLKDIFALTIFLVVVVGKIVKVQIASLKLLNYCSSADKTAKAGQDSRLKKCTRRAYIMKGLFVLESFPFLVGRN